MNVLTAVTDPVVEAALVQAFGQPSYGVRVVRRCVDLADLLATAATGTARAAVVSADLRRLDREALARLAVHGVAVVALAPDEEAERRLHRLGVLHVLTASASPADVANALTGATPATPEEPEEEPPGDGRVVAVWGPTGAPGRTTVAVNLAVELAALGVRTALLDADVHGGAVAQTLGMLDESPGLAAAVRLANNGALDRAALAGVARDVDGLRVLTGITRADRWPELRPAALAEVLRQCRSLADVTVVDCAFGLDDDDRNAATHAILDAADTVLAVGSADPIGLQRLVRALPAGADVVVNRVRHGVMPGNPEREITAALERYAGVTPRAFLPYDRAATDTALMRGLALKDASPQSALRQAIADLARALTPARV